LAWQNTKGKKLYKRLLQLQIVVVMKQWYPYLRLHTLWRRKVSLPTSFQICIIFFFLVNSNHWNFLPWWKIMCWNGACTFFNCSKKVLEKVKNLNYFGLIIDESTNIFVQEYLVVFATFLEANLPITAFVDWRWKKRFKNYIW